MKKNVVHFLDEEDLVRLIEIKQEDFVCFLEVVKDLEEEEKVGEMEKVEETKEVDFEQEFFQQKKLKISLVFFLFI